MAYFELDILPIVKNKRNPTTAITIKDHGLSRMPMKDRSCLSVARRLGRQLDLHHYIVFKLDFKHGTRGAASRDRGSHLSWVSKSRCATGLPV
jgi:hypothetical protein